MTAQLIDGNALSKQLRAEVAQRAATLTPEQEADLAAKRANALQIVKRQAELRAAELALREAEAAEEYAAAHPLLAKPVLAEGVAE